MIKKAEKQQQQKQPHNQSEQQCWKFAYTRGCIVRPWYFILHFLKFLYDICNLEKAPNADAKWNHCQHVIG